MEYTSIVNSTIAFGRYPNPAKKTISKLENEGFNVFLDLTTEKDNVDFYSMYISKSSKYYKYPILDRRVPTNRKNFCLFLQDIILSLNPEDKIYIHCKGGHGRAGITTAVILMLKFQITPQKALEIVYKAHQQRCKMKSYLRKIGSPQTRKQKEFVLDCYQIVKKCLSEYRTTRANNSSIMDTKV